MEVITIILKQSIEKKLYNMMEKNLYFIEKKED